MTNEFHFYCPDCGEELIDLGIEITPEEQLDITNAATKVNTANQVLDNKNIQINDLTPDQIYAFYKAACDSLAEGLFLKEIAFMNVFRKYNVPDSSKNIYAYNNRLYMHPEDYNQCQQ